MTKLRIHGRKLSIEFTALAVLRAPVLFNGPGFFHVTRPRDWTSDAAGIEAIAEILLIGLQQHHGGEFTRVEHAARLIGGLDDARRIHAALKPELDRFCRPQPARKGLFGWQVT